MRYFDLLFEYDQTLTIKNWGGRLLKASEKDPTVRADRGSDAQRLNEIIHTIESADPTPTRSYVMWLVREYLADADLKYIPGSLRLEDIGSTVAEELANYHTLKTQRQLPPEMRDINRLRWRDLRELPEAEKKEVADRGRFRTLLDNSEARVIVPEDEAAARFWGQGTRWCTAADKNNQFNFYKEEGPLFVIIPRHPSHPGEKYQFQIESRQFMDERDEPLEANPLRQLMERLPTVAQLLQPQAIQHGLSSFLTRRESQDLARQAPSLLGDLGAPFGDLRMVAWNKVQEARARLLIDLLVDGEQSANQYSYGTDQVYVIVNPEKCQATILDNTVWATIRPRRIKAMTQTLDGRVLAGVLDVLTEHLDEDDPDALRRLDAMKIEPGPGSAHRRIARWLHSRGVENFQ